MPQVFAGVLVGDRHVVFRHLVEQLPRLGVPMHFLDDGRAGGVAHAAGEDFHPVADFKAFRFHLLPEGAFDSQGEVAVVQHDEQSLFAIPAKDSRAGDQRAGQIRVLGVNPVVAVFRPPGIIAILGIGFHRVISHSVQGPRLSSSSLPATTRLASLCGS